MPAEKSPSTTASADTPAEQAPALTVNGLVVTSVPGMLTSLVLGVLVSLAYLGRRLGPVAAATGSGVAGAAIGLCLSIAF